MPSFARHIPLQNLIRMLILFALLRVSVGAAAQQPCVDTLVHEYDTICEGSDYDFYGRIINYSGVFFDTLSRANPDCDSIIMLHLTVLDHPSGIPSVKALCRSAEGYLLSLAENEQFTYYSTWSSQPEDPDLVGHEHDRTVIVSPAEPTTYFLHVDYSDTLTCPGSGSKLVNPLEPVVAAFYVSVSEIDYDHLEFTCEDFSLGTREPRYGWAGRNWFIDGVRQPQVNECVTFEAKPWWGDSVVVMMEGYSNTCIDTAYRVIPFRHVASQFPNAFTPGADNNNCFRPSLQGLLEYELWIYDRRGSLVFHTTDQSGFWDGTSTSGVCCPQGVYTYRCRYRSVSTPGGFSTTFGSVTLIR